LQPEPGSDDGSSSPASVKAAAQVFVADLQSCEPASPDVHHLDRVLRLRPAETVIASDGMGSWRPCNFLGSPPWLEPAGEIRHSERAMPDVTVGFVPVKGDRPEWVVQKLVEIGVDRVIVLRSERSVVRWEGDRAAAAVERLAKIATQAAAQSRRSWIPEVSGVTSILDLAQARPVALAQRGGSEVGLEMPVCVGPEGGWTDEELGSASRLVGLGQGVLRAETAAIVAGALTCALRDRGFSH
jgi:16S rRNA (uracil1498-N3)-methyltransferase